MVKILVKNTTTNKNDTVGLSRCLTDLYLLTVYMQVLYSELGGLHEQFSVFQEQLQSKMKTLQTIVPAVMRRDPHRETEMNG